MLYILDFRVNSPWDSYFVVDTSIRLWWWPTSWAWDMWYYSRFLGFNNWYGYVDWESNFEVFFLMLFFLWHLRCAFIFEWSWWENLPFGWKATKSYVDICLFYKVFFILQYTLHFFLISDYFPIPRLSPLSEPKVEQVPESKTDWRNSWIRGIANLEHEKSKVEFETILELQLEFALSCTLGL